MSLDFLKKYSEKEIEILHYTGSLFEKVNETSVEKIANLIRRGKRKFGALGANHSYILDSKEKKEAFPRTNIKMLEKLISAELEMAKLIENWVKKIPNAMTFYSIKIPEGEEYYDRDKKMPYGGSVTAGVLIGNSLILFEAFPEIGTKGGNYTISREDSNKILRGGSEYAYSNTVFGEDFYDNFVSEVNYDFDIQPIVFLADKVSTKKKDEYEDEESNSNESSVLRDTYWYKPDFRIAEKKRFISLLDEKLENIEEEDPDNFTFINPTLVAELAFLCIKPFNKYERLFGEKASKII